MQRAIWLTLCSLSVLAAAYARPVDTMLEAQVALARMDISCGCIDGVGGAKTAAALKAFQDSQGLAVTGALDNKTKEALTLESAPTMLTVITSEDLGHIQPLSRTWLGKSEQTALDYENALQLVAERSHASERLIRRLNPNINWDKVEAGTQLVVPDPRRNSDRPPAARLCIILSERVLDAYDAKGALIAHFPVSIARKAEKRPVGELHVVAVIPNPTYTFDPELFPESQEARALGRKLILPAGPKNPVGVAWIGLDLPGYGIHGTPSPQSIGVSESHGCFRLTNWDARTLLDIVSLGVTVSVEP